MQKLLGGLARTTTRLGLDIGQSALRIVVLRRGSGLATVRQRATWPVPTGVDGVWDETARDRAAAWLGRLGLPRRPAIVGLSVPDVAVHPLDTHLETGASRDAQKEQAATAELTRIASIQEPVQVGFWHLPESRGQASVMGVVATHRHVDQVLSLCQAARVDCMRIDTTACALARFGVLLRGSRHAANEIWGLLDLGARMVRLLICVDQTPVLVRGFDTGGVKWTTDIAAALGVTAETAERHKQDHGIADSRRSGTDTDTHTDGAVGEMIYNVLRSDLDKLGDEVERSYRYAVQQFTGLTPGAMILTGGGACMPHLDRFLEQRLGVPVWAPPYPSVAESSRLTVDAGTASNRSALSLYAAAVGLAAGD